MSNRPAIYISKSKSGRFDDLVKLKNYLSGFDVEIKEFNGGTYNTDTLLSCDYLIILPPAPITIGYTDIEDPFTIGRGQYDEYKAFIADNDSECVVVCVGFDEFSNEPLFLFADYIDKISGKPSWTEYAKIFVSKEEPTCIEAYFPIDFLDSFIKKSSDITSKVKPILALNSELYA